MSSNDSKRAMILLRHAPPDDDGCFNAREITYYNGTHGLLSSYFLELPFWFPLPRRHMSSSLSSILRRPRLLIAVFIVTIVFLTLFPWNHGWSSAKSFAESWSPHEDKRPNGVIFMLLPPSRVQQATLALKNVEERFNRRLKYPYLLFMVEGEYDEVTEVQKERIAYITQGRAKFGEFFLVGCWNWY